MHFDLHVPCSNCPFLRKGGIRLTQGRVKEIAGNMLSPDGKTFACHKTTKACGDEMVETGNSRHCAGALIFSEKHENATQMIRIAERLGLYDRKKLMSNREVGDLVFDSVLEMLRANSGKRR